MSTSAEEVIEVGAIGGDMRYWLAAEARRQGELRLTAQSQNITAMETRAISILAWSTAAMLALSAAALQGHIFAMIAIVAGACLMLASLISVTCLWPSAWHPPGYDFAHLRKMARTTELETLEQIALGYENGVRRNDARIASFARRLRIAWTCFAAAPLLSAGTVAILLV